MSGFIRSFLSSLTPAQYNIEWLWILFYSGIATVGFSAIVPNCFSKQKHWGAKVFNDFLARHQLSYVGYYLAIFAAPCFDASSISPAKFVPSLIFISFFLSLAAGKLSSGDRFSRILGSDHQCDSGAEECSQSVTWGKRWGLFAPSLALFTGAFLLACVVTLRLREMPPEPVQIPNELKIERVVTQSEDDAALPLVFIDHLERLEREGSGGVEKDSKVAIIESEKFGPHDNFRWALSLAADHKEDCAISVRAAYFVSETNSLTSFHPLRWAGTGDRPFKGVVVDIPRSPGAGAVKVVLRVYGATSGCGILWELDRMFRTQVARQQH